ncbi:MAG: multiheme c-type cytochrome, partial [bacterium]|nr:multiheme c-type cytochrome [bacterium]
MIISANAPRQRLALGLGCAAVLAGAGLLAWRQLAVTGQSSTSSRPPVLAGRNSADCRACHQDIYRVWAESDHAQAHRPVAAALDAAAFGAPRVVEQNGIRYRLAWVAGQPAFTEERTDRAPFSYTAEFVLGRRPLRQYIVPAGGGRYQAAELAFDPAKQEWFDVFGAEQRQPGEWGHWQGRGMNWNSMCALCHLTDYAKNYQAGTDTYASTWLEHGVGCVQCHGDLTPGHAAPGYKSSAALRKLVTDRTRSQQTCAPCHARNELLTGEPRPGLVYDDHFRVTLPIDAGVFYPDGQMRDEDFNWTSLLTSRMGGKAGVTCLDCHDPHSGKTIAPVANNALCLQCHTLGNTRSAPVIDPGAHSHHGADSTGNQCVSCHMPTTTYMQRDARHDHGFLRPDPLLTKELGIPNACARCHADQGVDWQIEWSDRWYGAAMDSRQRARARAVDAAQKGAPGAPAALLALLAGEEVPAWKASILLLARPWAAEAGLRAAAEKA